MKNRLTFTTMCLCGIYLFFSNIFITNDETESIAYLDKSNFDTSSPKVLKELSLEQVALLFDEQYESSNDIDELEQEVLGDIPISIKSIIIVGGLPKVKVEVDLTGTMEELALQIGDKLREYELTEVNSRYIRFSKDNNDYIVKVFKPDTLTTTLDK